MHMDCCAIKRGCDVCKEVLARAYALAGGGATGEDLREALVLLPALEVRHDSADPFTAELIELDEDEVAVRNG